MTSALPQPFIAVTTLVVLLAVSIGTDLRERRIPNRVVGVGLAAAAALHTLARATGQAPLAGDGAWAWLSGALLAGAALLPLYLLRACGAGDVKLLAMVGAFVGPDLALPAALYTLAVGGVLSLAVMAFKGVTSSTLHNLHGMLVDWSQRATSGQGLKLPPLATTAARLPYALAIAAGALLALLRPIAALA